MHDGNTLIQHSHLSVCMCVVGRKESGEHTTVVLSGKTPGGLYCIASD